MTAINYLRDLKIMHAFLHGTSFDALSKEYSLTTSRISNIVSNMMVKARQCAIREGHSDLPVYCTPTQAVVKSASWLPWVDKLIDKYTENAQEPEMDAGLHYRVISAESVEVLCERVNARVEEGWKASGGVSRSNGLFIQAITLEEARVVKEFMLVEKHKASEFTLEVNQLINEGWHLCGAMMVTKTATGFTAYTQTLVKY